MRILVDCDGVIFMTHVLWAKKYIEDVGDNWLTCLDDISSWEYLVNLLGKDFLEEYFTVDIVRNAPIECDMREVISGLMVEHDITFVTDVPPGDVGNSRMQRIMELFGTDEIKLIGDERTDLDADILIDDKLSVCVEWGRQDGKTAILIARPWNVYPCRNTPDNVIRVWSAHEIRGVIERV